MKCRRLRNLDIAQCNVTDKGLGALAQHCHSLDRLCVDGCARVGEVGLVKLLAGCPLLSLDRITGVPCELVTDDVVETAAKHHPLTASFDLSYASVTGAALRSIAE